MLKYLASLDFLRDALFLCSTPLVVALSIAETARTSAAFARSLSPESTAMTNLLIAVFVCDLMILLRKALLVITLIRFFADLIFAKPTPPYQLMSSE